MLYLLKYYSLISFYSLIFLGDYEYEDNVNEMDTNYEKVFNHLYLHKKF